MALLKGNFFSIFLKRKDGVSVKSMVVLSKPVDYIETDLFMTSKIICAQDKNLY